MRPNLFLQYLCYDWSDLHIILESGPNFCLEMMQIDLSTFSTLYSFFEIL
jgi:hypothetical protein